MKLKNLFAAGAAVVLSLGLAASVQAAGDPAKGQALYATCASCHGANGEGNQALNAPAIAGQQDWYLTRQLKNYQDGIRGTHAKDIYGMQMRPMSMVVMGDDKVADVVAYITSLPDPGNTAVTLGGPCCWSGQLHGVCFLPWDEGRRKSSSQFAKNSWTI